MTYRFWFILFFVGIAGIAAGVFFTPGNAGICMAGGFAFLSLVPCEKLRMIERSK